MKKIACIAFVSLVFPCTFGFAQSPNALGARKVQDYFQDVESKSYYQQERIRSMKGEMNEYSERLHGLQEKFHRIFYGKSTDRLHQSPFGKKEKISYPSRKYRKPIPMPEVESIVRRPSEYSGQNSQSNQLAFTVDESGPSEDFVEDDLPLAGSSGQTGFDYFQDGKMGEPKKSFGEGRSEGEYKTSSLGGYLIVSPGMFFPYKDQTTHNGPNKTKHRKYKTGFGVSLAGGYRYKGWNFGAGLLYRENEHDAGSYEKNGQSEPFAEGSESMSIAGFVEVGYSHSFNSWFGLYSKLGLGYGVSMIEDFAPLLTAGNDRTRMDPFFFASGSLGVIFTPAEFLACSLGYRYVHEREVPAHAVEIGLAGRF